MAQTDDGPVAGPVAWTLSERAALYADLGGVTEIARVLGVPVGRVKRWIVRRESTHSPTPVAELAGIHLYSIQEWQGWFALWRVTRGARFGDDTGV